METGNIETESSRKELAKDPKRKAKSQDPGWKFAYWPNLDNKDLVKCVLCGNENHGGINRFKQHLIGGYPDIIKCPKTTKEIAKEMYDFVQNKVAKKKSKQRQIEVQEDSDDDVEEILSTAASNTLLSSKSSVGNKGKAAAMPFNFRKPAASNF